MKKLTKKQTVITDVVTVIVVTVGSAAKYEAKSEKFKCSIFN